MVTAVNYLKHEVSEERSRSIFLQPFRNTDSLCPSYLKLFSGDALIVNLGTAPHPVT